MTTQTVPAAPAAPAAPVRDVDGTILPVAGRWALDPDHTSVEFVGRHFMLTKIRGRFTEVGGRVVIGEDPTDSSVEVTIAMASVESGSAERDAHLRSADLFDVEAHPTATFRGTAVERRGDTAVVRGQLTLAGITRELDLDVRFLGATPDPWGNRRAVFSARTELDREDWGVSWNMPLAGGGLLVSKRIQLEIESELILEG